MKQYLRDDEVKTFLKSFSFNKTIADGKSKALYATCDNNICLMEFKPSLRSITYERRQNISGTEVERMKACLEIFLYLEKHGIKTQLLYDKIVVFEGKHLMIIKPARQIPVEWITRYYAAGSIVKLFPTLVKEGDKFSVPLQKYDLKQEAEIGGVDDPTMNESYLTGLGLVSEEDLDICKYYLGKISGLLNSKFLQKKLKLVDLKMEFGKDEHGNIMLTDEISQDCMGVNDSHGNSLTKDVFRQWKTERDVLKAYELFSKVVGFNEKRYCNHE